MNEDVYQMCELALSFLEMTYEEKQQTFPNNDFSDEDFKLAAVDVLYSIQHYAKTGEQIFCARETTQHMIRVAQNQIQ
jgi:hypothetical protein